MWTNQNGRIPANTSEWLWEKQEYRSSPSRLDLIETGKVAPVIFNILYLARQSEFN